MSMTFDEWLQYGLSQGWNGPAVCAIHDGLPTTEEEDAGWELGADDCVHVLRLYQAIIRFFNEFLRPAA